MENFDQKSVEVKVPLRISGFFQMMNPDLQQSITDLGKIGSRGGGPALSAYGTTFIRITRKSKINSLSDKEDDKFSYSISINDQDYTQNAITSIKTLQFMKSLIPNNYHLSISHKFDLLLGAGYGTSGAGALGIAIGLKKLLNLSQSNLEVAKYAHMAEVASHTGLGTVGGQFFGGLTITTEPGYPFQLKSIEIPDDVKLILISFGSISTKRILTDPEYKTLIYHAGRRAMTKMNQEYSLDNYIQTCTYFLEETQIIEKLHLTEVALLLNSVKSLPNIIGAGMNQLGKSVFIFCNENSVEELVIYFKKIPGIKLLTVCRIEKKSIGIN